MSHDAVWRVALVIVACAAIAAPAQAAVGDIHLVSRADGASGAPGNGSSVITDSGNSGAISGNDRYVVFQSYATNLTADATGGNEQVFVRDLQTGNVTMVSRASGPSGAVGNDAANDPMISRTGRYVVFSSAASNLVSGDTNSTTDVFVRDLQTSATTRVSIASNGSQGNANSFSQYGQLDISSDGRYVVFWSFATNFGANTTAGQQEIYVRDRVAGTTTQLSRASGAGGALANAESDAASITPDGRYVAFESSASNLTATSDTNSTDDTFVRDLQNNTTTLLSHNSAGTATGNVGSATPSISDDGRYAAFLSLATDLVSGGSPTGAHVFVRNLQTDTIIQVDRASGAAGTIGNLDAVQGTPISGDGRYVAFWSAATNLTGDATGGNAQVFVRDLQGNTTKLVSRAAGDSGAVGNGQSHNPAITPDGAFIAFDSVASNLTSDTVTHSNVFLRQLLGAAPAATSLPAISGTALPGHTLACSQGSWSGGWPQTYGYRWNRDGSAISGATSSNYMVGIADAGHALTCTVAATNADSRTPAVSAAITVPAPALSGLLVSPHKVSTAGREVGGKCVKPARQNNANKHCRRAIRLKISFTLNETDTVTLTLKRQAPGRKVGGRCVTPTNKNKHRPRCSRLLPVHGKIVQSGKAGANSFIFTGSIGGHTLRRGTYQLTATAAGARPQTTTFTIAG